MRLAEVLGFVPTIIFPLATVTQLAALWQTKSGEGTSALTWSLFAVANFCLYVYVEKYTELQSIVGLLGTGVLDVAIVALIFRYRSPVRQGRRASSGGAGQGPPE